MEILSNKIYICSSGRWWIILINLTSFISFSWYKDFAQDETKYWSVLYIILVLEKRHVHCLLCCELFYPVTKSNHCHVSTHIRIIAWKKRNVLSTECPGCSHSNFTWTNFDFLQYTDKIRDLFFKRKFDLRLIFQHFHSLLQILMIVLIFKDIPKDPEDHWIMHERNETKHIQSFIFF